MGAVLAVLANPVVTKLASKVIDKVFNRKGQNSVVNGKVAAGAAAGTIVTVVLAVVALVDPGLVEVLTTANLAAVVAGVMTLVTAVIGYYQPEK